MLERLDRDMFGGQTRMRVTVLFPVAITQASGANSGYLEPSAFREVSGRLGRFQGASERL
eukprot:6596862-Prymnesium_polylepis.1